MAGGEVDALSGMINRTRHLALERIEAAPRLLGEGKDALLICTVGEGALCAVALDGTLNNPADIDRGWTVELAFPWSALDALARRMPSVAHRTVDGHLGMLLDLVFGWLTRLVTYQE